MHANPFLIGADPEFAFLDTRGDAVLALSLPQGKLGYDHGGRVVEIRPDPKHLASSICADIYRTLNRRELHPFRRYKWKAGAMAGGQAIGGHIHFDIPFTQEVQALDLMYHWFETLELLPRAEAEERRREGYGTLDSGQGHIRQHAGRLEYRTPPSWLYSPDLAHLTLTAFKLAQIDPAQTLRSLHTPSIRPAAKLKDFIRGFASSDDDASELSARLEPRNALARFRGDPSTDLKTAWELPEVEEATQPQQGQTPLDTPFPLSGTQARYAQYAQSVLQST